MHEWKRKCFTSAVATHAKSFWSALRFDSLTIKHDSRADPGQLRVKWSQACLLCRSTRFIIHQTETQITFWVIQQVLFWVTVFAFPSVPEWVIKSADLSSFLRPLQRIHSSLQLWGSLVFCLYRFLFSVLVCLYPLHSFWPYAFSHYFISHLFDQRASCFSSSPFESCMQEVVSELEHDILMTESVTHECCVLCDTLAVCITADMHTFFGIIVVKFKKKNSITD